MRILALLMFFMMCWCLWAVHTMESNMDVLREELRVTRLITAKMADDVIRMRRNNGTPMPKL